MAKCGSVREPRGASNAQRRIVCIAAGQDDQEDRAATVLLSVQGRAHAPHQAVRTSTCICPAVAMRAAYIANLNCRRHGRDNVC